MGWDDWKWGYLKGGWPEQGDNLPTRRDAPKEPAPERGMLDAVGGPNGIRRRTINDVTLRTRGGFPIFEGVPVDEDGEEGDRYRWFAVRAGTMLGLFDPYQVALVEVLTEPLHFGYRVAAFRSSEPLDNLYDWNDVWLLDDKTKLLQVNGRPHAKLPYPIARPDPDAAPRIPVLLLPAASATGSPYDGLPDAADALPAFAVGRVSVTVMQPEEPVTPIAPAVLGGGASRMQGKAALCGPRIEGATAHLGQLAYLGGTWDAVVGGWAMHTLKATMLPTSPYLIAEPATVAVDHASPYPVSGGSLTGTSSASKGNLDLEVGLIGEGTVNKYASTSSLGAAVWFPWSRPWIESVAFTGTKTYSRSEFRDTASQDGVVLGLPYSLAAEAVVLFDTGTEGLSVEAQTFYSGAQSGWSQAAVWHTEDPLTWHWEPLGASHLSNHIDRPPHYPVRGAPAVTYGGSLGSAPYGEITYRGNLSILVDAIELVDLSYERVDESGSERQASPRTGIYQSVISGNPTLGMFSLFVGPWQDGNTVVHTPETAAGYAAQINSVAAEAADAEYYTFNDNLTISSLVTMSTTTRTPRSDRDLSWITRDYLLYDKAESRFIHVFSEASAHGSYGSAASGSLYVSLIIESPLGTNEIVLYQGELPVGSILDIVEGVTPELSTGAPYIPPPPPRLFFNPPFCDQGQFPGWVHTSVLESASPVELIDFELALGYDDFDGGANRPSAAVRFAPRNLIEMLYAYVYGGAGYGYGASRYVVFNPAGKLHLDVELFAKRHQVSIRNGGHGAWMPALGAPYSTTTTKVLGRT